jgi:hypothetical protein
MDGVRGNREEKVSRQRGNGDMVQIVLKID